MMKQGSNDKNKLDQVCHRPRNNQGMCSWSSTELQYGNFHHNRNNNNQLNYWNRSQRHMGWVHNDQPMACRQLFEQLTVHLVDTNVLMNHFGDKYHLGMFVDIFEDGPGKCNCQQFHTPEH